MQLKAAMAPARALLTLVAWCGMALYPGHSAPADDEALADALILGRVIIMALGEAIALRSVERRFHPAE